MLPPNRCHDEAIDRASENNCLSERIAAMRVHTRGPEERENKESFACVKLY